MTFFNNKTEMIDFLTRAGYLVLSIEQVENSEALKQAIEAHLQVEKSNRHFLILGSQGIDDPIGCTTSRIDVLFEEPGATFQECDQKDCPICNE